MKKIFIIAVVLAVILVSIWLIWEDNSLIITDIKYNNSKIPSEFNGYRIVQISDLHNKSFGKNQSRLLGKIKKCNPDIIIITGDLVDKRRYGLDDAMDFIYGAVKIASVYYAAGNHEASTNKYGEIKQNLIEAGVIVLDNNSVTLNKNGQVISLMGVLDPQFYAYLSKQDRISKINNELKKLSNNENFKILLSHRPELIDVYSENNIDLVFTGHAHGGQIKVPFIGAIFAPGQGLFPKYTSGKYVEGNTTMIVNRGLGDSIIMPIRTFNRPEVVLVELQK